MKVTDTEELPFKEYAEDLRKISLNRGVPSVMVTDTKMKEKSISLHLDPRWLPLMKVLLK